MSIKDVIKNRLVAKRNEAYRKDLAAKENEYANWYRPHRAELRRQLAAEDHDAGSRMSAEVVHYAHLRSYILSGKHLPDVIIAVDEGGRLTSYARTMILDFFAKNPDINLVYGDEDRVDEDGELRDPWFKPDWSPDTFLSTFYFGSIFAVRTAALALINPGDRRAQDIESRSRLEADQAEEEKAERQSLDNGMRSWIYGVLCLKIAQADGGFSRRVKGRFPIGHIPEILCHAADRFDPWDSRLIKKSLTGRFSSDSAAGRLISIIIPSKDNPDVLLACIKSIEEYTTNSPYEIIVVDNGSSPENRAKVQKTLRVHGEKDIGGYQYIYEPMDFNFSRMCNLGAAHANGELLLFLNDDITIAKPGWLSYLSEKAKLPYVGAVGMKLLYPNSDMIQHAGVVNVHVGPIHKLQYCSNKVEWYFGYNKGVRNVIAVTGACLMLRTELFRSVGGFDEERFAVSFNDIDLCLRIFELGYYNVVRNNMYLYHHESLSRGDDTKDQVKSRRLSREQASLLAAHPALFRRDPFYSSHLVQDPAVKEFKIAVEDVELRNPHYSTPQVLRRPLPAKWENPVLRLGVEFANSLDRWLTGPLTDTAGEEALHNGYYIKGYSFVIDANQAVYDRYLLLRDTKDESRIWTLKTDTAYRPDIAANLTDQTNDELTGFWSIITRDALPEGSYLIGMLAVDRTSRQRIYHWSDVKLVVQNGI